MVFQSYGLDTASYNPINMSHAAAPLSINTDCSSKKRKAFEDLASSMDDYSIRPKLSLPRSAGLVFNGEAQFHPLPADVNQAMLSQLGQSPFAPSAGSSFVTPSSSAGFGHAHKSSAGSDYFASHYPDVEPYPAATGILGPTNGLAGDGMDIDAGSTRSSPAGPHGPHCKSIPQLCVRYNDGAGSELWATCPDCGACSKVDSSRPATNLCYSP